MIAIDSVCISNDVIELCGNWYNGQGCMLYAVASTGGLTCGSIRPSGCDTPEKWYLTIWREFAVDMMYAARSAREDGNEDEDALGRAEDWADLVCDNLAESYGLDNWHACDGDDELPVIKDLLDYDN